MLDFLKKKASFDHMGFDSDCHCHVLPAVDDGARNQEESFLMLREMISMGFRSVVLTPHLNPDVYLDSNESFIKQRYFGFISMLPDDIRSSLNISLGAEYMVTQGFEKRDPSELLQFKPGKVLIEMSYFYPSKNMEQAIFNIVMAGLTPVIAHPERYLYYAGHNGFFERFRDMGAEFQMNAVSLNGAYGGESMPILSYLLERGWYSYVATDAHSVASLKAIRKMRFDRSLLDNCVRICSKQ